MNTAAAELEVPEGSIAELLCAMKGYRAESTRNDVVRAIATPVVVAELRRLAALGGDPGRRANELEGEAGQ
jgi:hypothetical protein